MIVVPQPPAAIAEAEEVHRKAAAALQEGQQCHIEAGRRLAAQQLGRVPEITAQEVEAIGLALTPLFEAEQAARARRDEIVQAFRDSIGPALTQPLQEYRQAVSKAIADLERLLAQGTGVHAKAKAAGFDLGQIDKLPGFAAHLGERLNLVRTVFDRT
ncbi:MAG: hypothetical protein E5Y10_24950 [Mesorhizobium sp.]|uniref:hypothetical protein n=1 Tax=Mesorhizobium sp. TaxID=1871066 RepID=UPI001207B4AC|nr:hypothetical protein [Mesorhizobium sp.]TIN38833.1 MAG: hypothetical protein E5Y13_15375 [Mesorhizobium sp.]TJU85671.1 MAG: hypothetical protein E5Y10_24950 [Mesorhizobium sp.]